MQYNVSNNLFGYFWVFLIIKIEINKFDLMMIIVRSSYISHLLMMKECELIWLFGDVEDWKSYLCFGGKAGAQNCYVPLAIQLKRSSLHSIIPITIKILSTTTSASNKKQNHYIKPNIIKNDNHCIEQNAMNNHITRSNQTCISYHRCFY